MVKLKRKRGFFSISAVAKMFSVHQQTIRLYEKQGLINPKRSEGNTRLFSEEDVDRLEEVIYLTHQLGINLAGVEMIFKLKRQIEKMQKQMNKLFEETNEELTKEAETTKEAIKNSAKELIKIRQASASEKPHLVKPEVKMSHSSIDPEVANEGQQLEIDGWEIEYDDE